MSVDEEAYKKAKEFFVSGHNGTSVGEVALVLSVLSTSLWFYSELMVVVEKLGLLGKSKLQRTLSLLVIEFVLLVLPILISFTFTEFTLPITRTSTLVFAVGAIALGTLSWRHAGESDKKLARKDKLTFLMSTEKPAVTCFRAQMMICTCVAILAVDFTIFPRRFAKTETFGVSLVCHQMDSGVGLFIMSSALTSAYARGAVAKRASSSFSLRAIWLFLRPMLPVLVLGVIRYVSVKKVNYQPIKTFSMKFNQSDRLWIGLVGAIRLHPLPKFEHVTEYGVHWNFYFTLASLYFTFSLLALFGSIATSVPVALLLLAGYQVGLTSYGIADFIFHAPRVDLFSQNREGIFSLCGYLPLYLLSVAIGQVIFSTSNSTTSRHLVRGDRWVVAKLFMIGMTAWGVTSLATKHLTPPSRRLINVPYVGWIVWQGVLVLTTHSAYLHLCMSPRVPLIFTGISRNQLFVFLIANLITGAVNLSMQTLYAPPVVGFGIMLLYLFAVSVLAVGLEWFHIKVKL
ncbi:hypothetical protein AaE_011297 [Aphanomyces astaci]|uniref:GPI-anchored wall transfer protein 1 n=1 Tax=Aphanomyces astaci TaxID=112090 RepID=A0A6A4ZK19_APHAT|nr:hypothetical protein AaE_011297 [Aphanomyces astaci]